jgi:bidirectional [NiFe] hydrogenase diaphorase subunit
MATIKINGRPVEAQEGTYILESARSIGLDIPALCDFASLEPHGACRLCIVEVTHPNWPGWRKLVTSCNYSVSDGLEVHTDTPLVRENRRELFNLLLARCPETELVQRLARRYGGLAETTREKSASPTDCILCDMCVRVCEERSTSALAHAGRGADREVNPPTGDCVGCGACALICPTDFIAFKRGDGMTLVWEREFPIAVCAVNPDMCRACGLCEEKCYFNVARVKLFANGRLTSFIDSASCQGCGSCIAVCPTGAIAMELHDEAAILARVREMAQRGPHVVVFACPRSPIPEKHHDNVIVLPCIGRVSLPMMSAAVLSGARKVVLLGRDPDSCHFGEGERQAVKRVAFAEEMARLLQLGASRFEVIVAPPGLDGPENEIERILSATYSANILETQKPLELNEAGYDQLASALRVLCAGGITPDLREWADGLHTTKNAGTVLYINRIAVLDHLIASLTGEYALRGVAACALDALGAAGVPADVVAGRSGCSGSGEALKADVDAIKVSGAKRVLTLCPESAKSLAAELPGVEVKSLDEYMLGLAASAKPERVIKVAHSPGYVPPKLPGVEWIALSAPAHEHGPFMFRLEPQARLAYTKALVEAQGIGADFIICACPAEFMQIKLLQREGAWRLSRVEPVTITSLACMLLGGGEDGR